MRQCEAVLQARDGGGMVSQPSRVWMLALRSGHQHSAGLPCLSNLVTDTLTLTSRSCIGQCEDL